MNKAKQFCNARGYIPLPREGLYRKIKVMLHTRKVRNRTAG
jgi:hypothetical protein